MEAIAASARGEDRPISQRATWTRTAATWLETVGLSSVGRESAIVETGGALGSLLGRRTGGRGDALVAAGIASAFAAAYHAPVAAVLYVEEALDVHASRRGLAFTAAGAYDRLVAVLEVSVSAPSEPRMPSTSNPPEPPLTVRPDAAPTPV